MSRADGTEMWFRRGEDSAVIAALQGDPSELPAPRSMWALVGVCSAVVVLAAASLSLYARLHRAPAPMMSQATAVIPVTAPKVAPVAPAAQVATADTAPTFAPVVVEARAPRPAHVAPHRAPINPELVAAQQLLQQGHNEEALARFQRVLAHHHNDAQALKGTCAALDRLGRTNDAARVCRHALDKNPDDIATRRTLATIYFNGGAYKWSAAEWRRVLSVDPRDERARRGLKLAQAKARNG